MIIFISLVAHFVSEVLCGPRDEVTATIPSPHGMAVISYPSIEELESSLAGFIDNVDHVENLTEKAMNKDDSMIMLPT